MWWVRPVQGAHTLLTLTSRGDLEPPMNLYMFLNYRKKPENSLKDRRPQNLYRLVSDLNQNPASDHLTNSIIPQIVIENAGRTLNVPLVQ